MQNWNVTGYVRFKPRVKKWLAAELPEDPLRGIARELYQHVEAGGEIDEQKERRTEWDDHEFHFDLRVRIETRHVYFETLLYCDDPNDPDDPFIEVVNVHDV